MVQLINFSKVSIEGMGWDQKKVLFYSGSRSSVLKLRNRSSQCCLEKVKSGGLNLVTGRLYANFSNVTNEMLFWHRCSLCFDDDFFLRVNFHCFHRC